ncbi:hypothetical protein VRRI112168_00825 [Vreelandella rituensis]
MPNKALLMDNFSVVLQICRRARRYTSQLISHGNRHK